eukprot:711821_1
MVDIEGIILVQHQHQVQGRKRADCSSERPSSQSQKSDLQHSVAIKWPKYPLRIVKIKKIEKLTFDKANLEASMEKLQREKDDLYNKLGAYLDHNEIAKLKDKLCLLSDTKAMELI